MSISGLIGLCLFVAIVPVVVMEIEKLYKNAKISKQDYKTKDCYDCYYYEDAYDAPCGICRANKCPYHKAEVEL